MAIPERKRAYLRRIGWTDEDIAQLETKLERLANEAKALGLEFKEQDWSLDKQLRRDSLKAVERATGLFVDAYLQPTKRSKARPEPSATEGRTIAQLVAEKMKE
jgi:hypothetical protein